MQRFFLLLITATGLVSCSSSDPEVVDFSPERTGGRVIDIGEDGGNNPFAFKKEDIQRGDDGSITGGKRSQFAEKKESAYASANRSAPAYTQRSYQKGAWSGGKDYRTGSYETAESKKTEKRSWFGGRKSKEANQVARAAGQSYGTGSFGTSSASETGRSIKTGSNAYAESRTGDGWGRKPVILSQDEYRSISLGQAKSLLGR